MKLKHNDIVNMDTCRDHAHIVEHMGSQYHYEEDNLGDMLYFKLNSGTSMADVLWFYSHHWVLYKMGIHGVKS